MLNKNIVFRFWEGECAAYNIDSGNTHLLTSETANILVCIQDKASKSLLLQKVCVLFDVDSSDSEFVLEQLIGSFKKNNLLINN